MVKMVNVRLYLFPHVQKIQMPGFACPQIVIQLELVNSGLLVFSLTSFSGESDVQLRPTGLALVFSRRGERGACSLRSPSRGGLLEF